MLAVGVGLHRLVHHDVRAFALHLGHQFHLNPASHYPSIILHAMSNLTDARLQLLALGALAYSGVRFAEAYGLWRGRRWAEWLAALGGGVYIPFELYHLSLGVTAVKLGLLAVNVAIVAYMVRVLRAGTSGYTPSAKPH